MKFNKGILTVFVLFLILFICLGSAYAQEEPQGSGENSTGKTTVGESNPSTPLNAGEGTYTTLRNEVGNGGNVTLTQSRYKWVGGDGSETIKITNPGVIDGKGAVIEMQEVSDMRIFEVKCDGVTFKNITFMNAFYIPSDEVGGVVYFQMGGSVINCSFVGNEIYDGGGVLCFAGSGNVSGCSFTNNTVQKWGGAVYFSGSGNVSGCSFVGNHAEDIYSDIGAGGAVYFVGSGSVTNCNFTGNTAKNGGGAVFFVGSGSVISCNFMSNNAGIDGGAVYFNRVGSIIDCNFTNNTAHNEGGAVFFDFDGKVSNCNFVNNFANSTVYGGGAIFFSGTGNVTDCNFTNNTATRDGGAVCFISKGNVTDCNFTNNTAHSDGGAISMVLGAVTDCNFTNNKVSSNGGAIRMNSGTVTDCNFTNNTAHSDGGAIRMNSGTVTDCNFTNNKVSSNGGAVYFDYDGYISNCSFTNNTASWGGAIGFRCSSHTGTVTNCSFTNNTASWGGAVYFDYDGKVSNCSFTANYVNDDRGSGGAVSFGGNGDVSGCSFTDNYVAKGTCGGAVYFYSLGNVSGSIFTGNSALLGAAIYIIQSSGSSVQDSIFINNGGYTIFAEYDDIPVINSWFGNNATNYDTRPKVVQGVNLLNWLFLNASANPSAVPVFGSSDITFKLYSYNGSSSPKVLPYDNSRLMPVNLTITSVKGTVNSTIINPGDSIKYTSDAVGTDSVTASIGNVFCTIEVENFKVKKNLTLSASADPIVLGENATVVVSGFENATGNVSVYAGDGVYVANISGGVASAVIPGLIEDTVVEVHYLGDDNYNYAETSIVVSVLPAKKNLTLSITAPVITVGENATVVVSGFENATGNASAKVANDTYIVSISKGVANFNIPDLTAGNHTVSVIYSGDYMYNGATGYGIVTVNKVSNVTIVVEAPAITVGENATVTVALPGDATGSVLIGDENVTLNGGVASAIISGLPVGVNTVPIVYSGDGKYDSADTVANIVVNEKPVPPKENLTIVATAAKINVGEDAVIVVTGFKNATGNVSASIGSGLYSAVIVNGVANITVSGLNDNVTAFVSYTGDDRYNPADTSVNITVYGIIVNAPELTKYYRSSEKFVVNVTDAKGQAIANKSVDITVNGVTYHRTTNAEGTASLSINLNSGEYGVNVVVDDVNVNSSVIVKATIDASDLVKVFRNASQYYARFLDVNGSPTANVKVSFNINGVIYNRTTDANGDAKLNINLDAGEYILTATNTETGEMKSNIIKVISLIEADDLTKYYKNDSQFVVRIHTSDGGYVGAGEEVTFNINGMLYTRTTNATGHAKLNINLNQGNYTVTTYYKDCGRGNNIVVLPVLNATDLMMKYLDGSQFKAELVDGEGNPYLNQSVDFNINGVFYNRTTDDSGVAKLNIRLMPGVYIITSSFNGCNVANNITVTA